MNNSVKSYIAGFIDGDGSISLSSKGPQINIVQTEKKKDILEYIQTNLQRGKICLKQKKKAEFNSDIYSWYCCASNSVYVANEILPFIIEKKERFNIVSQWICGNYQNNSITVTIKDKNTKNELETLTYSSQGTISKALNIKEYIIRKYLEKEISYENNNKLYSFTINNTSNITDNHKNLLIKYEEIKDTLPSSIYDNQFKPLKIKDITSIDCHIDIYYITGFVEAEGCFGMEKNGNKEQIKCQIGQKNINILLQVMKYFNMGTIYYNKSNNSFSWVIKCSDAVTYLNAILPYVISKSVKTQIKMLLDGTTQEKLKEFKGCSLKKEDNPRIDTIVNTRKPIKEGELKCSICNHDNFKDRWTFNRHMKTHEPPSIKCDLCEYKCRRKEHLKKHIENIHT